jgi:release factor glutamine methyltransferase
MNDEELLLSYVLNCQAIDLYTRHRLSIPPDTQKKYKDLLSRRKRGEPLQYIMGSTQFMGLEFKVGRDTFIPRPETEILIEALLEVISGQQPDFYILDIGTGCGNIAVTLAKFTVNSLVLATDISEAALRLARLNAKIHNVLDKVYFLNANILKGVLAKEKFTIIVSNPPYITDGDLQYLPPEVRHEPPVALNGREDGLFFLREIIDQAPGYLKRDGWLGLEIGKGQAGEVHKRIVSSGEFSELKIIKDYNSIERVVIAKKA